MKTGTKSLLWGVHQIVIHPVVVLMAWMKLYGWPNWRELVCIIIHDWGYWGSAHMDDARGELHPVWAAGFALLFLDRGSREYCDLCLLHSRHFAKRLGAEPSKLCWADKLSILYEPWWFYLARAWASGELDEYRETAAQGGFFLRCKSHRAWFTWIQDRFATIAQEKRGDAVPYANQERSTI